MDFWQWGVGPDLAIRLKPFLLVYQQLNELGMIDTSMICVDENAFHRHIVSACHFIHAHIGHARLLTNPLPHEGEGWGEGEQLRALS